MTENKPLAMRSNSSSICCSEVEGLFRIAYDECGTAAEVVFGAAVTAVEVDGLSGGGMRENSDGEGDMNERYWSKT